MRCLDTYALIAVADGDEAFARFINEDFVVPSTTLAEFYWVMLRDLGKDIADGWISVISPYAVDVDSALLLEAVRYRSARRKDNVSFFDAVGYVYSKQEKFLFVTGDEAFRGEAGVEFVKSSSRSRK
ncbi:MAG: PIN domain-containing protein [Nanoarchaeota archaeon]|mgnify:CR=1 FL=1